MAESGAQGWAGHGPPSPRAWAVTRGLPQLPTCSTGSSLAPEARRGQGRPHEAHTQHRHQTHSQHGSGSGSQSWEEGAALGLGPPPLSLEKPALGCSDFSGFSFASSGSRNTYFHSYVSRLTGRQNVAFSPYANLSNVCVYAENVLIKGRRTPSSPVAPCQDTPSLWAHAQTLGVRSALTPGGRSTYPAPTFPGGGRVPHTLIH